MFCPRCGMQNADGAIYCTRCGSAVTQGPGAAGGSPTVVVVGGNAQQVPVGSNPGTVWLWLNIILTVLCCMNLGGIIGIIFGGMSVSKFNNGLYAESKSNASVAKWMFFIGLILGIIGIVISILAGAIPFVMAIIASITNSASLY